MSDMRRLISLANDAKEVLTEAPVAPGRAAHNFAQWAPNEQSTMSFHVASFVRRSFRRFLEQYGEDITFTEEKGLTDSEFTVTGPLHMMSHIRQWIERFAPPAPKRDIDEDDEFLDESVGGPRDAYAHAGDLYCEPCAHTLGGDVEGPFPNGGGEADGPQNCAACGCFMHNPLTTDGEERLRQLVGRYLSPEDATLSPEECRDMVADRADDAGNEAAAEWVRYYDHVDLRPHEVEEDVELTPVAVDPVNDDLIDHVASLIEQGYTEGHHPIWALHIGDEVRGDEFALQTIADLVRQGATGGRYPQWTLSIAPKA